MGKGANTNNSMTVTIGRSSENDLVIQDPEVSGTHMLIIFQGDNSYLLKDLNSTNGTYVNGTHIKTSCIISDKDTVVAGNHSIPWQTCFSHGQKNIKYSKSGKTKKTTPLFFRILGALFISAVFGSVIIGLILEGAEFYMGSFGNTVFGQGMIVGVVISGLYYTVKSWIWVFNPNTNIDDQIFILCPDQQ